MMSGELKARIGELEAVAEYVPPAVLGQRLLASLEDHLGDELQTINMWTVFQDLLDASPDETAKEDHVGRWVEIPVRPTEDDIARAHELNDKYGWESKAEPAEIFDPGIPADGTARAAPETPDPAPTEPADEDLEQPAPVEPAEDTKVCKRCEREKPLSAFGKHSGFKDGLDNRCRECRAEMRRTGETSPKGKGLVGITSEAGSEDVEDLRRGSRLKADATKEAEEEKIREFAATRITVLPPAVPAPEPEEIRGPARPKAPERFCANGDECLSFAQVGRPTKLTHGNRDRRCFACQEAEIGESEGETMRVRHSAVDQEAG